MCTFLARKGLIKRRKEGRQDRQTTRQSFQEKKGGSKNTKV